MAGVGVLESEVFLATHPATHSQTGTPAQPLVDVALSLRPLQKSGAVPEAVAGAMQRTVAGLLGQLPSADFAVSVRCDNTALGKLLHSAAMTGYLLRGVEVRHSLRDCLDSVEADQDARPLAPPSESVLSTLPADVQAYVSDLEARLVSAQTRLALEERQREDTGKAGAGNVLLAFLRAMHASQVDALAQGTPGARLAVQALISSMLGRLPSARSRRVGNLLDSLEEQEAGEMTRSVQASKTYLAELLEWTLWAGWHLKACEERLALCSSMADSTDVAGDDIDEPFGGPEWRPFLV